MAKILYGTDWISEDEPCMRLVEVHKQSPDSRGFHRYQIITLLREGKPYQYIEDLGMAKDYAGVPQLNILGGVIDGDVAYIEENVGNLREIALRLREDNDFDKFGFMQHNRSEVKIK